MRLMKALKREKARLKIVRNSEGVLLKDSRYHEIPEYWVKKNPSGSYSDAEIYIQVKQDRWVTFSF